MLSWIGTVFRSRPKRSLAKSHRRHKCLPWWQSPMSLRHAVHHDDMRQFRVADAMAVPVSYCEEIVTDRMRWITLGGTPLAVGSALPSLLIF